MPKLVEMPERLEAAELWAQLAQIELTDLPERGKEESTRLVTNKKKQKFNEIEKMRLQN